MLENIKTWVSLLVLAIFLIIFWKRGYIHLIMKSPLKRTMIAGILFGIGITLLSAALLAICYSKLILSIILSVLAFALCIGSIVSLFTDPITKKYMKEEREVES